MNKLIFACIGLIMSVDMSAQHYSEDGPTMGWSSWNTYGFNISESIIKKQVDAMVANGYSKVGYRYINIDDGYFGGRDSEGHLLIHPTRFPNGMKTVVDYIHAKGLKAGIYSDAGKNTCASYFGGDKIGEGVGLLGHEQDDANLWFNELGFDFIKVDFCGGSAGHNKDHLQLNEEQRYRMIWQAILNTGRTDVRMNICRWAFPGTWATEVSTSWRTTGDINCSWGSIKSILKENFYLSAYSGKGRFNDMDMLEVGRGLSNEEDKTHFGMWCMMNSPLLIGCDMTNISTTARNLMCNKELIALNQDTLYQQAYVVKRDGETYIMVRDIETLNGKVRALAMVNLSDAGKVMEVNFADLDLGGTVRMRDLFLQHDMGDKTESFRITVPAHATRIYRLEADERYERTVYEAEAGYNTAYQEITNNQTAPSAAYSEADNCSGGAKAGWLGKKAENDLQWKNVYSKYGGSYTMTIDYMSGENRYVTVQVNGRTIRRLQLNSGNWGTVKSATLNIELNPGNNVIRLFNTSDWMPDIDCMRLEFNVPAAIDGVKSKKKNKNIYSIDGVRQTEATTPGIYIIDGKKVKL